MRRVAQALDWALALGLDRLDAQVLMAHAVGRTREWVIAHDQDDLPQAQWGEYSGHCQRRSVGVPLAYLTGWREFHGLQFEVTPDVLIPRPDTEVLVDWALELIDKGFMHRPSPTVVELGTGSGAIAVTLAFRRPHCAVAATDISAAALAVAQRNASRIQVELETAQGNWWQPLDRRVFDLVVANPPYIAAGDAHLANLTYEPRSALCPEQGALADLTLIVAGAAAHIHQGGWLLLEHGFDQAAEVSALLELAGFGQVESRQDLSGRPRCTGGCRP